MSDKKFLLIILSLIFFSVSLILLIAAMVLHAIFNDGSFVPMIIAGCSFFCAFAAIVTTCLSVRGSSSENKQI